MGSLDAEFRTLGQRHSLAISESEDDPDMRNKYRPFLLPADVEARDWISELELDSVIRIAEEDMARTNPGSKSSYSTGASGNAARSVLISYSKLMAYKAFEDEGDDGGGRARLLPSGNRDRLVDCVEEFVKHTIMMRPHVKAFADRFSERRERQRKLATEP